MALKRAGVELAGILPNTLAVPEAVLTPDEKEEGVAVIDIGGGVTDVTVYYRNVVRYVASIPMGSAAINHDIRTMGVPERFVESLKQKYGSAVAERVSEAKLISITGRTARESRDILLRNLATVIESRAMDIVDFVKDELKISGYENKLAYGLVLTGGSANLKDLDELFRIGTGLDVRVAQPENGLVEASLERVADPSYATVVGLLLQGAERSKGGTAYVLSPRSQTTPVTPTPARPAVPQPPVSAPVAPRQSPVSAPTTPVVPPPIEKPYVPAVEPVQQPAKSSVDEHPASNVDEKTQVEPQPNTTEEKKGGFWGWIKTLTENFESPGDEEI